MPAAKTPLTPYQIRLLLFLSVATFFEGFDFFALSQILPRLGSEWRLDQKQLGLLVAVANLGTVVAYLLVRKADRWGRKPVLTLTIAGYTLFSLATAASPNVYVFALCQLASRVFLIAEWAVAIVYAAEEFPADRRGLVIGIIQANSSFGSIACAGLVPLLLRTSLGWRMVFLVGVVPLLVVAVARRNLRETGRFIAQERDRKGAPPPPAPPLTRIFHTPYRRRLLQLAAIWGLTYVCTQTAITFWKTFALAERGLSEEAIGRSLIVAAVAPMPFVFAAGKLLDHLGRRRSAVLIFIATSAGIYGAYTFHSPVALAAALGLGIFGTNSVLPVLNAYTTELFPTDLRSDAFAWANNLLGRITYVISPWVVGWAAKSYGWGSAVSLTAIFPLFALGLILLLLPETTGKELEETSAMH